MFEQMANEGHDSEKLQVEMVTIGGATLKQHWLDGRARAAIEKGGWDYVVLQEHSTLGSTLVDGKSQISDPQSFHMFVRLFDQEIQRNDARTVLFLTWANEDKTEDQTLLNKAYIDIAIDIEATVIPVGPVWQKVRQALTDLNLYLEDKLHPSAAGSYVAASVFYAHLFDTERVGKLGTIRAQSFDSAGVTRSESRELLVELPDQEVRVIQTLVKKSLEDMPDFIQKVGKGASRNLRAPELPLTQGDINGISDEWVGELLFYKDTPATMTLVMEQGDGQWQAKQEFV